MSEIVTAPPICRGVSLPPTGRWPVGAPADGHYEREKRVEYGKTIKLPWESLQTRWGLSIRFIEWERRFEPQMALMLL
jgi:hypothetical protein